MYVSRLFGPVTWSPRPSRRTCPTLLATSTGDLEPVTIYFWTATFSSPPTSAQGAILGGCQGWSPGWLTHPPTAGVLVQGRPVSGFNFQSVFLSRALSIFQYFSYRSQTTKKEMGELSKGPEGGGEQNPPWERPEAGPVGERSL